MSEQIAAAIDIGGSKIAVLVGGIDAEGKLDAMALSVVPSVGIKNGAVLDIERAAEAIRKAVAMAEEQSDGEIGGVFVSVSSRYTKASNSHGSISVLTRDNRIDEYEISRVLEEAGNVTAVSQGYEIIHTTPQNFVVDGQSGIKDPEGMFGYKLEVDAYVVMGLSSNIMNIQKCLEEAKREMDGLVVAPLASGMAVATREEMEVGVAVVDVGEDSTEIGIFLNGGLWYTSTVDIAGALLTSDVATILKVPREEARRLKEKYGDVYSKDLEGEVTAKGFGANRNFKVSKQYISDILRARTEELFEYVLKEIKRSAYDELLTAGVVFTGGTSRISGFLELAQEVFPSHLPVRLGSPHQVIGEHGRKASSPEFARAVGTLRWGLQEHGRQETRGSVGPSGPFWKKAGGFLKSLLPY